MISNKLNLPFAHTVVALSLLPCEPNLYCAIVRKEQGPSLRGQYVFYSTVGQNGNCAYGRYDLTKMEAFKYFSATIAQYCR